MPTEKRLLTKGRRFSLLSERA